jgi:hypothetical protein
MFAIEVEADGGPLLAFELFGGTGIGRRTSLPGGAALELQAVIERRSLDVSTLLAFGLTMTTGATTSLVAAWLYDKFKGRARALRIKGVEVHVDKGEIEKVLIHEIEVEE